MYHEQALRRYQRMDIESRLTDSTPHGLVGMLLDGVQKNLNIAKGAVERQEISRKGEAIGKAISIVDSLRASLDHEQGGTIAANLAELYAYMERRLLQANMESSRAMLDEVGSLVEQIRSAWNEIPDANARG